MKYQNNPLNIRHTNHIWNGEVLPKNGFCQFSSVVYCIRAGLYLFLKSYRKHGCFTVRQCITRFAPPSENNTESYISYISQFVNVDVDVRNLSLNNLYKLFRAMCRIESYYFLPFDVFLEAKSLL